MERKEDRVGTAAALEDGIPKDGGTALCFCMLEPGPGYPG